MGILQSARLKLESPIQSAFRLTLDCMRVQAAQSAHAEHLRAAEGAASSAVQAVGAVHTRLCADLEQHAERLTAFAAAQAAEADAAAAAVLDAIEAGAG